ncbi:MAG: hypothetical protein WB610_19530, partial [Rhodomicrobium sp.]
MSAAKSTASKTGLRMLGPFLFLIRSLIDRGAARRSPVKDKVGPSIEAHPMANGKHLIIYAGFNS